MTDPAMVVVFPSGERRAVFCQMHAVERLIGEYEREGAIEIWQGSRLIGGSAKRD